MTNTPNSKHDSPRTVIGQIGRVILWLFAALLIFWMFLMMTFGSGFLEPVMVLTTGWGGFLARTVPSISWNWDLIGMAALCSAVVLSLAHWFLNWITNKIASARRTEWRWRWKWTWCGLSAVLIFFLVGMAVGGTAHQIGWLISSPGPWYEEKGRRWRDFSDMRQLASGFQKTLEDEGGDIENVRQELWKPNNDYLYQSRSRSSPPLMQEFHLLVVTGDDGKVAGTIIFPRDAEQRATSGAYFSIGEKGDGQISAAKLPELIQKHRAHLVAL